MMSILAVLITPISLHNYRHNEVHHHNYETKQKRKPNNNLLLQTMGEFGELFELQNIVSKNMVKISN